MSHFALIDENNIVTKVIVAEQSYVDRKYPNQPWLKTSYNTRGGVHYDQETGKPSFDQNKSFRKNFAGVGCFYDPDRDAFIPPKPYPSWILDEQTCLWTAPVAMPTDDKMYRWDEDSGSWVEAATA
jgi:hypothetical protein